MFQVLSETTKTVVVIAVTWAISAVLFITPKSAEFQASFNVSAQLLFFMILFAVPLMLFYHDSSLIRRILYVFSVILYLGFCGKQSFFGSQCIIVCHLLIFLSCIVVYANRPHGPCWKFVQNEASNLSERLYFTNDINDMLFSHGLIGQEQAITIRKRLWMAKWTSWNTYDLLMNILPRTDNSKYMKFCCLLRAKSILPSDGKRLCDKCKPLQKCRKNETVKFFIDPACHSLLKDGTAHDVDSDVPVDMNYVSDPENEEELVVFTSSVVCINNEIFATLTINIKESTSARSFLKRTLPLSWQLMFWRCS